MSQTHSEDTICALATAAGGAIGIIRMSGPQSITIADKIFKSKTGKSLTEAKGQTLHYGTIIASFGEAPSANHPTPSPIMGRGSEGEALDDVLLSIFRAPHSYTGEDSVELSCHGSKYILQQVLQLLIRQGARQAEPGEYTKRAFTNGKLDLSQAEAVADLIASTNAATHRIALSQLRGNFSTQLTHLREQLLQLTSLLELELDFSDHEELEFADRSQLQDLSNRISAHIARLRDSFRTGNAIKRGIPVAIVGKTNVGKSTLLNRLVGEERAIVSDIHGTTRDAIEDTVTLRGIDFRFIDTAGLRDTTDEIERIGIARSYKKIDEAQIVVWLIDQTPTPEELSRLETQTTGKTLLIVENKMELHPSPLSRIRISAKDGAGIPDLIDAIVSATDIPEIHENDVIVTSARHYEALCRAHDSIALVIQGLEMQLSGDLLAEDLRQCINHLGEIVGGAISTEETLQSIFSHFCIGK